MVILFLALWVRENYYSGPGAKRVRYHLKRDAAYYLLWPVYTDVLKSYKRCLTYNIIIYDQILNSNIK